VTRDDEPGCENDPARHRGTVFRLLARDTEVTARVAADLRAGERRALVVAGSSEYGVQLDAQLRLAGLRRAASAEDADLVVFCGLSDDRELELVRSLAPLPLVAFDGVQGADLKGDVQLALPYAPSSTLDKADVLAGVGQARAAATLVREVLASGARDRASMLSGLRQLGRFDEHGDPLEPEVWLWRVGPGWTLEPSRPI